MIKTTRRSIFQALVVAPFATMLPFKPSHEALVQRGKATARHLVTVLEALATVVVVLLALESCGPRQGEGGAEESALPANRFLEWIPLEGGEFQMGSETGADDDKPVHSVTLDSFWMSKTETTVAQYLTCVEAGACREPDTGRLNYCNWGTDDRDTHPVNCIDWHQAADFAGWVGGRLPTEAEWEYAARSGGREQKFPWGDETADCTRVVMNSCDSGRVLNAATPEDYCPGCGRDSTWPACWKPEGNTTQGLCDMSGNVWEWVADWYDVHSPGPDRVIRGGSFLDDARYVAVGASQRGIPPGLRRNNLGFRVLLPAPRADGL